MINSGIDWSEYEELDEQAIVKYKKAKKKIKLTEEEERDRPNKVKSHKRTGDSFR